MIIDHLVHSRISARFWESGMGACLAGTVACSLGTAQAITLDEAQLIDEGFRVFNEETFDGNGRTCSTCHIPELNYTIGPRDIDGLSQKDQNLVFARNVPGLENEVLVRELGLFNIGPGDATLAEPEGPFRASMAVSGLEVNVLNNFRQAPPAPPVDPADILLGWAGDGSPTDGFHHGNPDPDADGSIRAFANGAIAQHNPRSLSRIAGVDFRFATTEELDAMDAFQRWLGRRAAPTSNPSLARYEFDLDELVFSDRRIEEGKALFRSNEASCNVCHFNGGGNFDISLLAPPGTFPPFIVGANILQETGVEEDRDRLSEQVGVNIPEDEGSPGLPGAFNLQSVIESPRKHAFFHNSAIVGDVEDAAVFYFRPPFARTDGEPGTGAPNREALDLIAPGHLDSIDDFLAFAGPDGFDKIGAFMRGLSVFYALRDCERFVNESLERIEIGASAELPAMHCAFNLEDIVDVLTGNRLRPRPHLDQVANVRHLVSRLPVWAKNEKTTELEGSLKLLAKIRRAIAQTPELTEPSF